MICCKFMADGYRCQLLEFMNFKRAAREDQCHFCREALSSQLCLSPGWPQDSEVFGSHGKTLFFMTTYWFPAFLKGLVELPRSYRFYLQHFSLGWSEKKPSLCQLHSHICVLFALPAYCWSHFILLFCQIVMVRVRVLEGHLLCSSNGILNIPMCFSTCGNNMLGAVLVQLGKLR